ncbi:hypothetical protein HZY62_04825 [Maribacter polysiphoniae]|nr:hypothetical protein [Maribacter polysiphoniae]MBD1259901.1 hypothetical protein [Maribacter polysiphoniae]
MKKLLFKIFWLFIFISSCAQSNEITKEDNFIISKIIDDFTFPVAPPPPMGSNDTIIPKKIIDSLLKIKMIVGVYPQMESSLFEERRDKVPKRFNDIIDTSLQGKNINNVDNIRSKKGHILKLADTVNLKKSKDYDQFDLLYSFSRVWYNRDETMAILEFGVSRSKLYGSAQILCLEKIDGNWSIVKSIPTTSW